MQQKENWVQIITKEILRKYWFNDIEKIGVWRFLNCPKYIEMHRKGVCSELYRWKNKT